MSTTATDVVSSKDFRHSLEELRAQIEDPNLGLFGPDSVMWRMVTPMPVLPMALIQAALLEAPQPAIAYGTVGSQASTDFLPRFHRSADAFFDWFCGDVDAAFGAARKVFGYHSKISGEIPERVGLYEPGNHFEANEQDVLIWVWATIIKPIKDVYERLHGRLSAADTRRYYEECRRWSQLFGIDADQLPTTWERFNVYFDDYVASGALELSSSLGGGGINAAAGKGGWRARMVTSWLLAMEASMLPRSVRRQYDYLPTGPLAMAVGRVSFPVMRVVGMVLPRDLRSWPRVRTAYRRAGVEGAPGRMGRWLANKLPAPYGDRPGIPLGQRPSAPAPAVPTGRPAPSAAREPVDVAL
jgi:uncharacterized protein (DUF2236 family)